jgi:hypothetical protein
MYEFNQNVLGQNGSLSPQHCMCVLPILANSANFTTPLIIVTIVKKISNFGPCHCTNLKECMIKVQTVLGSFR